MDKANRLKVIIPVAGEGTRLRPHTYSMPKPLIPVAGRTILDHILDPIVKLNPDEVIFVIGHLGEQIIKYVRDNYEFKSTFVTQSDLLGLGFAVHLGIRDIKDSPIMVVLGDTIAEIDLSKFATIKGNCIGLKEVDNPRRFGVAVIENDRVVALEEKPQNPKSNLAVIGLYYFESSDILKKHLYELISQGKKSSGEFQLTDAMANMIDNSHIFHPCIVDGWYDCGKKESLLETNRQLLNGLTSEYNIPSTEIISPVAISPEADIRNSTIGPYVSISRGARIIDSVIENSIIFENASIESCQLDESLIGVGTALSGANGKLNIGETTEVG
jgi:glucose-1-phosphate thymidylyltransferase